MLQLSLDDMQSEHDTTSRTPNRFRSIVYTEGELDASDLTQPPSPYVLIFATFIAYAMPLLDQIHIHLILQRCRRRMRAH